MRAVVRGAVKSRIRNRAFGFVLVALTAVAVGATLGTGDYQGVLPLLATLLIAILAFLIATGNVEAIAVFVLPASYLPLPGVHIASAVFGPSVLVAPALLLAGAIAASREGIQLQL